MTKEGSQTGIVPADLACVVYSRKFNYTENIVVDGVFRYPMKVIIFNYRVNTCGATVTNNCSYIQNPEFPSSRSTAGSCNFNIRPLNSDICQLRLDFENLDLTETTAIDGTCVDTFDVTSGSSRNYYALCGTLSSQHSKYNNVYKVGVQRRVFREH